MRFNKGFTLIELLIVIAILGALAVIALIAINPAEQLARTRDAGRQSTVTQLGRALEAYGTQNSGNYVAEGTTWINTLVTAGEVNTVPSQPGYTGSITACTTNAQNGWCYDASSAAGANPAVVFARLESSRSASLCSSGTNPYAVYSTAAGRGGIVCTATTPAPGVTTFVN